MKKVFIVILIVISIMFAGCNKKEEKKVASSSKVVKLRVAHNSTNLDNPYQVGLVTFADTLHKASGGKMMAEVFAGTLGTNESELAMKLTTSTVDLVIASPGFLVGTGVKEFDLFSLLYLFSSYDNWEQNIDGSFGKKMMEVIKEKSNNEFVVLGYFSSGIRNYYGKKPIIVPEDAKGLNIRTQNSPVQQEFWKRMEANPISVGWAELYQALNTGVVDAAENDFTNMSLKEHHNTPNGKYTSLTMHDITTRLVLMSGKKFDSFTKEQQDWIKQATKASVMAERKATVDGAEKSRQKILADGGKINEVDLPKFQAIGYDIINDFVLKNNFGDIYSLIQK